VIRALLSLATGWNMIAKPPVELEWSAVQIFGLAGNGEIVLERANVMLDEG
jgi:probable phosphoglycerate mutase